VTTITLDWVDVVMPRTYKFLAGIEFATDWLTGLPENLEKP
jgi:hypothetical protein